MELSQVHDVLAWVRSNPSWNWLSITACALAVPLITLLASWTLSYIKSPLRSYPGPYLAGAYSYPFHCLRDRDNNVMVSRMDKPLALSRRVVRQIPPHPQEASQQARARGSHWAQSSRPRLPRTDQNHVRHERGMAQGKSYLPALGARALKARSPVADFPVASDRLLSQQRRSCQRQNRPQHVQRN